MNGYEGKPTGAQVSDLDKLAEEFKTVENSIEEIINKDLSKLNDSLTKAELEEIKVMTLEEYNKDKD